MTTRRRHRLFLDHKPPLVAFVVLLVTSVVMLAYMVRSEAAPGWVGGGLGAAGGAVPLAQHVVHGSLLERSSGPARAEAAPVVRLPAAAGTPAAPAGRRGPTHHPDPDPARPDPARSDPAGPSAAPATRPPSSPHPAPPTGAPTGASHGPSGTGPGGQPALEPPGAHHPRGRAHDAGEGSQEDDRGDRGDRGDQGDQGRPGHPGDRGRPGDGPGHGPDPGRGPGRPPGHAHGHQGHQGHHGHHGHR